MGKVSNLNIFGVRTKAGIVTRTTNRTYTHAVVNEAWPAAWCGRYDLAVKEQRKYPGSTIVEVELLKKQPADPHPEIKTFGGCVKTEKKTETSESHSTSYYDVVQDQGKLFARTGWMVWVEMPEVELIKPITGYLDRLWIIYQYLTWKGAN